MGFLGFFRAPTPIRDAQGLADFIDQHAAFLMQKGIYEYSRARAGHYAKVLFRESGFQEAVERSRWRADKVLVAAQAALSLLLIIGAGLFLRTINNLRTTPLGYEPGGLR